MTTDFKYASYMYIDIVYVQIHKHTIYIDTDNYTEQQFERRNQIFGFMCLPKIVNECNANICGGLSVNGRILNIYEIYMG